MVRFDFSPCEFHALLLRLKQLKALSSVSCCSLQLYKSCRRSMFQEIALVISVDGILRALTKGRMIFSVDTYVDLLTDLSRKCV